MVGCHYIVVRKMASIGKRRDFILFFFYIPPCCSKSSYYSVAGFIIGFNKQNFKKDSTTLDFITFLKPDFVLHP